MAINAQATQARGRHAVQFAAVDEDTAGTFQLAAAPGEGKRIAVLAVRLNVTSSEQRVTLKSGTTALFGSLAFATGGSLDWADPNVGVCACASNEALSLTTSHASQVSGVIAYVVEDAL